MKSFLKILAAGAFAVTAGTATAAEDGEHKFELAGAYYAECIGTDSEDFAEIREDVRAFTDMVVMAETMNDPEKLFRLMAVINDPRTIHIMMNCATEPVMWDTWMTGMTNPEKWAAAATAMMNPDGMVKWMLAPVNENVWGSIAAHAELDRYDRWFNAFGNAAFYKPVTSMVEWEWYEPRLAWVADPMSYAPMLQMVGLYHFVE